MRGILSIRRRRAVRRVLLLNGHPIVNYKYFKNGFSATMCDGSCPSHVGGMPSTTQNTRIAIEPFHSNIRAFCQTVYLFETIYERKRGTDATPRDIINGRKRQTHNHSINYEKYEINDASNFGMDRLLTTSMPLSYSTLLYRVSHLHNQTH